MFSGCDETLNTNHLKAELHKLLIWHRYLNQVQEDLGSRVNWTWMTKTKRLKLESGLSGALPTGPPIQLTLATTISTFKTTDVAGSTYLLCTGLHIVSSRRPSLPFCLVLCFLPFNLCHWLFCLDIIDFSPDIICAQVREHDREKERDWFREDRERTRLCRRPPTLCQGHVVLSWCTDIVQTDRQNSIDPLGNQPKHVE